MPVADLRARLAALHPEPWPPDRAAAAAALAAWKQPGTAVVYLADGLTDGADFPGFAAALRDAGAVTNLLRRRACAACCCRPTARPTAWSRAWRRRRSRSPRQAVVLAQTGDGRTLARDHNRPAGRRAPPAPRRSCCRRSCATG